MGLLIIKLTMYADDTAVIVRSQEEIDALIRILTLYCKATGAKVNWEKTYLLLVSALQLMSIPGVRLVSPENWGGYFQTNRGLLGRNSQ